MNANPPAGRKKILVADEQHPVLRLVEANLTRAGHELIAARNGQELLDKARVEFPDLIVLDADLTDPPASEVLRSLADDPATAGISVLTLPATSAQIAEAFGKLQR